jgi:hypothetical protein
MYMCRNVCVCKYVVWMHVCMYVYCRGDNDVQFSAPFTRSGLHTCGLVGCQQPTLRYKIHCDYK